MRLKLGAPPQEFPEPYDQGAMLDRAELATSLTSLFGALEEGSVSILHGRWGVGKTTFAKRWAESLKEQGFGVVYFDAFSHDYMGEPFDALISAVLRIANEKKDPKQAKIENLKSRAASVSRALATTGLKAGIRIATLSAIDAADLEALSNASKGISGDAADIAKDAAKNLLERRATDMAAFESFRSSLGEIHSIAGAAVDAEHICDPKTIFIVDELDRCRPDFALSLVESLKHFFRTDGLHFVLVTNREYLSRSVNARYGLGDKSDEYLQKFYDFIVHFEQAAAHPHQHASAVFGQKIVRELLSDVSPQTQSLISQHMAAFAVAFDLTLRHVEHVATNLALSYLALNERKFAPAMLIMVLAFLKALHPKEYGKIKANNLDFEAVDMILRSGRWPDDFNGSRLRDIVRYHMDENLDPQDPEFQAFGQGVDRYFLDRMSALPFIANNVMDQFSRT